MLTIRLFGTLDVSHGDRPLGEFHTQKCQALFAMLVLRRGQSLSREQIVGQLWAEFSEERARKCLSSDLWRLKERLNSAGVDPAAYIKCTDRSIAFDDSSRHWVDVHKFQADVTATRNLAPTRLTPDDVRNLDCALDLYRGDLLQDVTLDYFMVLREAIRAEFCRALKCLMECHMFHARLDDAIACGKRLLAMDPLAEQVHQELMLCHFRAGDRAAALHQYAACEQALWDELQVGPMPATREIYQRLVATGSAPSDRPGNAGTDRLGSALRHLEAATLDVQTARNALAFR